jgi:hypothetical protein
MLSEEHLKAARGLEAGKIATTDGQTLFIDWGLIDAMMNAARREERERAIAVLRPFAKFSAAPLADFLPGWVKGADIIHVWKIDPKTGQRFNWYLTEEHLSAASSYINQAQEATQ